MWSCTQCGLHHSNANCRTCRFCRAEAPPLDDLQTRPRMPVKGGKGEGKGEAPEGTTEDAEEERKKEKEEGGAETKKRRQ